MENLWKLVTTKMTKEGALSFGRVQISIQGQFLAVQGGHARGPEVREDILHQVVQVGIQIPEVREDHVQGQEALVNLVQDREVQEDLELDLEAHAKSENPQVEVLKKIFKLKLSLRSLWSYLKEKSINIGKSWRL